MEHILINMYVPIELQELMISFVDGNDTFKVSTVCKLWFNLLNKKFKSDDFSVKSINDSFALKRLFDVHEKFVLAYVNVNDIHTTNCLNLIIYKTIRDNYFHFENFEGDPIFSEKYEEYVKKNNSISFELFSQYLATELTYDLLHKRIHDRRPCNQKYIINLIKNNSNWIMI